MGQSRKLEKIGLAVHMLDRAVALAGSRRLVYDALCRAVEERALTAAEALRAVERELPEL